MHPTHSARYRKTTLAIKYFSGTVRSMSGTKRTKTQLHVIVDPLFAGELRALQGRWSCTAAGAVRRAVQVALAQPNDFRDQLAAELARKQEERGE